MMKTTPQLCAVRRDVLGHVGNRWSALLLTMLEDGPLRYSKIHQSCGITTRMLTLNLRELERDGLIAHDDTTYALTDNGRSLCEIIRSLISWSDRHHDAIVDSRERFVS
jgi:DNA-binding HxlR family transcriptional regulator